jgi:hypothetical protein
MYVWEIMALQVFLSVEKSGQKSGKQKEKNYQNKRNMN